MAKTPEAVDRTAVLKTLNREVEEQKRFTESLEQARDIVAKAMLGGNGTTPIRQHRPRRARKSGASRTQMLKTILANTDQPVSVDDIVAEMARHGRHDDRRLVHSTLSYLKRTSQVKNVERGLWIGITEAKQKQAA